MPLLDTPDERMRAEHDCGEAAARCALGFLRVTVPANFACEINGTDPITLENFLRKRCHLRVQSGEMSVDDLRNHADQGRPVLLLVTWPGEPSSHWLCSRGVSRGRVYYHDPDTGRGSMPVPEFEAAWKADDGRLLPRPLVRWGIAAGVR